MRLVRQHGTAPELTVRKIVTTLGVRYTTKNRDLPGSPDLANRSKKFAIFVHGCYWHRHRGCSKATTPRTNVAFWEEKFHSNVERDRRVARACRASGYRTVVVWECECKQPLVVERRLKRALCPIVAGKSGSS